MIRLYGPPRGQRLIVIGLLVSVLLWASITVCSAQDSDRSYNETLEETLKRIEEIFDVELQYNQDLVEGKTLNYAFWRIRQGNLENSLTALLSPFDLTYFKENEVKYTIKPYQYHKKSSDTGAEQLDYFKTLYQNKAEWEVRKEALKACMIEALGIKDLPEKPTTEPIITKRRNYKGYSVENVAMEVLPGVYTTGSVYRPKPLKKDHPIIIMPNGHFGQGRYRESQQIRSATLARMGAVVVGYDLFAWGESLLQFESEDHRLSVSHTIQTLNGIQWINYLSSLKETNPDLVGITGGSGGGSQTMLLTAIDDRIKVSVPTVMVSSHFSGGCPCESGKPIHLCEGGTNNAEIAAMTAPRPLLIISDGGDWSSTVPEIEFPFIERTYGFYGAKDKIVNAHFAKEGHDYKYSKRQAMYPFMAKHLGLSLEKWTDTNGMVDETGITIESENELKVFGEQGENLPENALIGKEALFKLLE
ncbi:S9 family peptidase [Echinicola sp. 20G]|uniref:alpha/beta hydrolase family protein n=1 Tax=Echinicola sp. 20G TaxID=2781961 RepID=UPI001911143E|nr:acetylxylan esterase [Echinicola sp. 20G]